MTFSPYVAYDHENNNILGFHGHILQDDPREESKESTMLLLKSIRVAHLYLQAQDW